MLDLVFEDNEWNLLLKKNERKTKRKAFILTECSQSKIDSLNSKNFVVLLSGGNLKKNSFAANSRNARFLLLPAKNEKKSIDLQIAKKISEKKMGVAFLLNKIIELQPVTLSYFVRWTSNIFPLFLKAKTPIFFFSGKTKRSWRERNKFFFLSGLNNKMFEKNNENCKKLMEVF